MMRSEKVLFMDGKKQKIDPPKSIFGMQVTLQGIEPPIWRRFFVPGGITLHKFHKILQAVMGWQNYHLYSFTVDDVFYGKPDPGFALKFKDSRRIKLEKAITEKTGFVYVYDFGDNWEHKIQVEAILPVRNEFPPICLGGERACPPEDVGGTSGYSDSLEAISNPKHEEHENLLTWAGGKFDPDHFDIQAVNEKLRKLR
jgi:hypothetical protein